MTSTQDVRVDAYIAAAAPFAQPILHHLRHIVHHAVDDVAETIKYGMPHFVANGRTLAAIAAFNHHASFALLRGSELGLGKQGAHGGMGSFGRLTSLDELPADAELLRLIAAAAALDAIGPRKRAPAKPKPSPEPRADLLSALAASPVAQSAWHGFSVSARRDYVEWIDAAKRADTRAKRIAQTIAQVSEGKTRDWKYPRRSFVVGLEVDIAIVRGGQ